MTSGIDPTIRADFSMGLREPHPVLTGRDIPAAARSTSRPPIYFLYGQAGSGDPKTSPPRTYRDLRLRQTHDAGPMIHTLPDALTPLGYLFIDGYSVGRDWLTLDALFSIIESLPPNHVFWFDAPRADELPQEVKGTVRSRGVVLIPDRLMRVLAELASSGFPLDELAATIAQNNVVSLRGGERRSFVPPPELRVAIDPIASIVDDSWNSFLAPLSAEQDYNAFRRFHGNFGGPKFLVEGVRRGYAIRRDFERQLREIVSRRIESKTAENNVILVAGQSGSGKSIAMARLVHEVSLLGSVAVLYSSTRVPSGVDVDAFCYLAERSGALATVIVCDCNASVDRYRELLDSLRSRARKVLIIGTTYRIAGTDQSRRSTVEAAATLSPNEQVDLLALFSKYGSGAPVLTGAESNVLLAHLYRALPASRPQLVAGLNREARSAEALVRERGSITRVRVIPRTALAEQLIAAKLVPEDSPLLERLETDPLANAEDAAGQLIDFVMLCGRLGCFIPLTLLMRALSHFTHADDYVALGRLLDDIDLIRIRESGNEGEDLLVSPRLALEAELICKRRLGEPRAHGQLVIALIRAANLAWDAGGSERRFVIELLRRLGPDGPLRAEFADSYLDIARTLTELREERNLVDPSLVLQESGLLRSAVQHTGLGPTQNINLLLKAAEAVDAALDEIDSPTGRTYRQARVNLLVEQATVYGFLAVQRARLGEPTPDIWQAYEAGRALAKHASGLTSDEHPRDVRLWMPERLLREATLPNRFRYELKADAEEAIDATQRSSLSPERLDRFLERQQSIGYATGDLTLSESAFKELDSLGSTTGYYLRTREIGGKLSDLAGGDAAVAQARASAAIAFLIDHFDRIKRDSRCLRYLLSCKWFVATNTPLFVGERQPVPVESSDRQGLLHLVQSINELEGYGDNLFIYLEATLHWLQRHVPRSKELWNELSRSSEYVDRRRLVRRHILVGSDRKPAIFSGRVESRGLGEYYTVRVEELGQTATLRDRDFPSYEITSGTWVPRFSIAFSFLGPIAEPPRQ